MKVVIISASPNEIGLTNSCVNECIETLKQETRRYAKRQLTWFRRYDNLTWLDLDKLSTDEMIEKVCEDLGKEGINV